jgi:NAD(P)-dependent dehydrogenase (short-subunit alcohol dehydrogenase family)
MTYSSQKWVLISGAAGGIGKATVEVFMNHGWQVVAVDRKEFNWTGSSAVHTILADISNPDDIELIYSKTNALTSTLDAVINNASIQVVKPILETSAEEWDLVMASNLRSVFLGARLAHPLLKAAGGGAIVNVSSVHAVATSANIAAYAASKGGLLALTRAMAIEFAPDNIRVNAILPGAVDTPMLRAGLQRGQFGGSELDRLENLARKTVNGRVGQPEEIASCIYFLADNEQSSFMTGQALVVDGGATARLSTE